MDTHPPSHPEETEKNSGIITMNHLKQRWEIAINSLDSDDFDRYFEGVIEFYGNLIFLKNKGSLREEEIALFDHRMEPISKSVENQELRLDEEIFVVQKLTPDDIETLFPDVDGLLERFRDEIIGILGEVNSSWKPGWEAIVARVKRGDKPLH